MNPKCPKCGKVLKSNERKFVTSEPLTGMAKTWDCASCKTFWKKGQGLQTDNGRTTVRRLIKI